jgi:uncharacterized membrane protein SirB2
VDYAALKLTHQLAVRLSVAGFALHGAAALAGANWACDRAARTLPHLVDSVLLGSALALVWLLRLNPLGTP